MVQSYAVSHRTQPHRDSLACSARRTRTRRRLASQRSPRQRSPRHIALAGLFLLMTLVGAGRVLATPAPVAAAPTPHQLRSAEALATEAKALFRNKVYADAARLFMQAYAVIKRATLVYNAARARQENAEHRRAESLFLMYLELPDATIQGKIEAKQHLVTVRSRLAAATPVRPAPPPVTAEKPPLPRVDEPVGTVTAPERVDRRWPWIAAASGVLAVVAGGTYGVAYSQASDLDLRSVSTASQGADYRDARDGARTWRNVAVGAGVAAVGLGAWAGYLLLRRAPAMPAGRAADATTATGFPGAVTVAPFGAGPGLAVSWGF